LALPCNNLNLNLYRVFYTVAKTKSFSESSRTLHISQPAISKHIQNLEYELNTLLFYRTNRGIELTPEAKALLVYVEKAYNYLMLGERELQEGKELTKGKVSIGTSTHLSFYCLNNYIKDFMKSHPNIVINISNHNDVMLFELLQQHNIDLLITTGDFTSNKELKSIELSKTEYCFAYDKTKLELSEIKTLEDIFNNPVLLPSKNSKQRTELEKILSTKSIISTPIMEIESSETMLNYIKEGIGIGYIQKRIIEQNENIEIITIEDKLPEEIVSLIYNDDSLTTSSREFINMITNNQL
jgi:DNA-binding transcriptional LysR family regulator